MSSSREKLGQFLLFNMKMNISLLIFILLYIIEKIFQCLKIIIWTNIRTSGIIHLQIISLNFSVFLRVCLKNNIYLLEVRWCLNWKDLKNHIIVDRNKRFNVNTQLLLNVQQILLIIMIWDHTYIIRPSSKSTDSMV